MDWYRQEIVKLKELAEIDVILKSKYLKASSFPWLPVSPDPPEPELESNPWGR